MKETLLILLLISSISYSQTKEETLDWLNLKLETYGDNSIMGTYQVSIKDDDDYGKILFFTKKNGILY